MKPLPLWLKKLAHWEFWPAHIALFPFYAYVALHSIGRGFFFFTAVNPGMYFGGLDEKKKDILDKLPIEVIPQAILIKAGSSAKERNYEFKNTKIKFPVIAKPDLGLRGGGPGGSTVEKIIDQSALDRYFSNVTDDIIIQEFIETEREFGVFYIRLPWQKNGRVTSLMEREFLTVVGDGVSSLESLIKKHRRGKFYAESLLERHQKNLSKVLKKGEKKVVMPIGNHCRGTKFKNRTNDITPELSACFDNISKHYPGFYYGRYDVKANTIQDLSAGKLKILELNGYNSEPAHVYDPSISILQSYKDYFWHMSQLIAIAKYNLKNGAIAPSLAEGLKVFRKYL